MTPDELAALQAVPMPYQVGIADNNINELWPTSNTRYKVTDRYRWWIWDDKKDQILDKETNMMNRLERRRHAENLRWINKLKWYGWVSLGLFFGLPVVIKIAALCWEWMLT